MSRYDLITNRISPKADRSGLGPTVKEKEEYIIQKNSYMEVSLSISNFEYGALAAHTPSYIQEILYRELCRKIGWPIAKEAVKFTKRVDECFDVIFSAWVKKEV